MPTDKTILDLQADGYTSLSSFAMVANAFNSRPGLRGTSQASNAIFGFRSPTVVNKSVVWIDAFTVDADKAAGGLIQLRDAATNKLEVEMQSNGSLRLTAPGGSTALLDTALGPVPGFNVKGARRIFRISYFSDPTNGTVKLEHWDGAAWVTLGEKNAATEGGTYNSDPHGTGSTLYQWQGRFKVTFDDDGGNAGDYTP